MVHVSLHPMDLCSVSESSVHLLIKKSRPVLPWCSVFKQRQWTERSLYKQRIIIYRHLIWGQNIMSTLLGKCWLRFDFYSNLSSVWDFAASVLIIQNCRQQHGLWTRSFRFLFIVHDRATLDCTNSSGVVWVIWVILLCFDENRFQVALFGRIESELLFRSLKSITSSIATFSFQKKRCR